MRSDSKISTEINNDNNNKRENMTLEPRVAKLEGGLDRLADDVHELAGIVRTQGAQMEEQFQKLAVSITQAAGPRKTDWSLIISGVLLIMAIGSAVFWPLNQTSQNNKSDLQSIQQKFENHTQLPLHLVGQALLQRLEDQLKVHVESNAKTMKEHIDRDTEEYINFDKKLQLEYSLVNAKVETQISSLDTKLQLEMRLLNKASDARIDILTELVVKQHEADLQELRSWRQKSMGLSSPSMSVPLITKELNIDSSKK